MISQTADGPGRQLRLVFYVVQIPLVQQRQPTRPVISIPALTVSKLARREDVAPPASAVAHLRGSRGSPSKACAAHLHAETVMIHFNLVIVMLRPYM